MSLAVRRTPSRYLLAMQDVLRDSGVQMSQIAKASDIALERFYSPTSGMTNAEFERFVEATRTLTGRSDMGFEMGRCVKPNSHGAVGFALISATTMHEFFFMLARYSHLIVPTWASRYQRNQVCGELVYTPRTAPNRDTLHFVTEARAVAIYNMAALMLRDKLPAFDVHMPMPMPEHGYNYKELERGRFHFHENVLPSIRFVMPSALLDLPLALGNPEVMRDMAARYGNGSTPAYQEVCWSDYVSMLLRQAPGMQITLEGLGRHIQVSGRSIDRHLKKEGVSYRELADKVRFERACQMLGNSSITVTDLAEHLGFSETANFSRAFKRVVGLSPGEYRQCQTP